MSPSNDPVASESPSHYEWDGETWYLQRKSGYYTNRNGSLLHRSLWAKANGPVPDGYEVHHVNRKRWDNRLANLALLERGLHRRLTWTERTDPDRFDSAARSQRTSDGLRAMWANREPREVVCHICGSVYLSTGMRAKFCSDPCRKKASAQYAADARARRAQGDSSR